MNHPGPWYAAGESGAYIHDANGYAVCMMQTSDPETRRLILAAPELRDMLRGLIAESNPAAWARAEALLDRIEGGPTHAPNDPPPKRETVNKPRDLPVSIRCPECGTQATSDDDDCCLDCGRGMWTTYADGREEDAFGNVVREAKP